MIWLLLAPLDLLVNLMAFPLAPLIALLTSASGVSPCWAWPWLTPDNPIDGDVGHISRWASLVGKWPEVGIYCRRVAWLWRNRGYGFSVRVTGRTCSGPSSFVGDRSVSDNPFHAGVCRVRNGDLWELYVVRPILGSRLYIRLRLGWKIPLTRNACTDTVALCTHISIQYKQ